MITHTEAGQVAYLFGTSVSTQQRDVAQYANAVLCEYLFQLPRDMRAAAIADLLVIAVQACDIVHKSKRLEIRGA